MTGEGGKGRRVRVRVRVKVRVRKKEWTAEMELWQWIGCNQSRGDRGGRGEKRGQTGRPGGRQTDGNTKGTRTRGRVRIRYPSTFSCLQVPT